MNGLWFLLSVIAILHNRNVYGGDLSEVATYEEVKDLPNHPEKYLIDVRSTELVEKDGVIPGSILIPYAELEHALDMENDAFKRAYGREKPSHEATVIFSCLDGNNAKMASELAQEKGWHSAKPYLGSWKEWALKEKHN